MHKKEKNKQTKRIASFVVSCLESIFHEKISLSGILSVVLEGWCYQVTASQTGVNNYFYLISYIKHVEKESDSL